MPKKRNLLLKNILAGWKSNRLIRLLLYLTSALVLYFFLMLFVIPTTYQLTVGEPSNVTLYSPIKIVEEQETERLRKEASDRVRDVYSVDATVINDQKRNLDQLFTAIEQGREQLAAGHDLEELGMTEVEFYEEVAELGFLKQEELNQLVSLTDEKLRNLKYISITTLDLVMAEDIGIQEIELAFEQAEQLIADNPYDTDSVVTSIANSILKAFIKPNYFFDAVTTQANRDAAVDAVEPVYINKDELLITEGEIVDTRTYERLKDAGLLKDSTNIWPYLGLVLLSILLTFLLYYTIRRMHPYIHQDNAKLLMLLVINITVVTMFVLIGLMNKGVENPALGYLAPLALGVMLVTILYSLRFAIVDGIILAIIASVIFNMDQTMIFDFRYGFVLLIGAIAGGFAMKHIKQRSSLFIAGLVVSLANMAAIVTVIFLTLHHYSPTEMLQTTIFGILNGLISAVLMIGMLPLLEAIFGVLSPVKLTELSNANHPLLRKLLIETPGTYHHSLIVGNLAESAAEAIGADGLLARVGAYYHDIGKTKRPSYFVENQTNIDNPHDKISPIISKNIIIAHTTDGLEMLRAHKLPIAIQDIAVQHHGTSVLKYFYNKALKEAKELGKTVDIDDYRYLGPKPQTKESAIVGIADSLEATVRSMTNVSKEEIEEIIEKIIKEDMLDNQFNECDLTFKELEIISQSMFENLKGIFHSRIEYPEELELAENEGENEVEPGNRDY